MTIKQKKTLTLLGIILLVLTVGIGTIVVVTRLSTTEETVAPTAPESKPKAAEWLGGGNCNANFTIATPSALTCLNKTAYRNDSRNTAGSYFLTGNELATTTPLAAGQTIVYAINYKNNGASTVTSSTITDVLDSKLTFVDGDTGCSYSGTNRTVTCIIGEMVASASSQRAFRVRVNSDATPGTITNTAMVAGGE